MRKIKFFTVLFAALLVSGGAWGADVAALYDAGGQLVQNYTTIASAISAASDGQTVKLLQSVSQSDALTINKAITFDLNGFSFTYTGTGNDAVLVNPGAGKTVTIDGYNDDSSQKGSIIANTAKDDVMSAESGDIVINGCSISTSKATDVIYCATKLTVSNTIISGTYYGIDIPYAVNVVIGDGVSVSVSKYAIYARQDGVNISTSSALTKVYATKATTFTINAGCSISTSTWTLSAATTFINNGSLEFAKNCSYALNITNKNTCSISTGKYSKDITIDNQGTFNITGGQLTADFVLGSGQSCVVTGGAFAVGTLQAPLAYDRISGFIQSGYHAVNSYVVSTPVMQVLPESENGEASYNGSNYATLNDAIKAAMANTQDPERNITLLKNATLTSSPSVTNTMTLDIGAYNVECKTYYFQLKGGDITLKGSGTINSTVSSYAPITIYTVTNAPAINLDIQGSISLTGSKYGLYAYSYTGDIDINIASKAAISGGTYDIYFNNSKLVNITNPINADIVCNGTNGSYIGNITSDGGGSVLIKDKCKIKASSYAELKDFIESGYKGFRQMDAIYGDVYYVQSASTAVEAKVGEEEFAALTMAIQYSSEAMPAVLQKNVTLSSSTQVYQMGKIPCMDLNSHTLTISASNAFLIYSDGLSIVDNSVSHSGVVNHTGTGYLIYSRSDYATDSLFIDLKRCTINTAASSNGCAIQLSMTESGPYPIISNIEDVTFNCPSAACLFPLSNVELNLKNVNITTGAGKTCIQNNGSDLFATTLNIVGGTLTSGDIAIYWPGIGSCNISGNPTINGTNGAVEIRSGELNISNGTFTCTGSTISCSPNNNGTTTTGTAITVAQHTTKQPVVVTINGGTFTAPMAMIQVNPQNNTEAEYKTMIVNVNSGYFKSTNNIAGTLFENQENYGTVTYYADDIFISQNRRIFLRGGYFNNNPINFVATGFQSKKLEDIVVPSVEDLAAMDSGYVYKVGEIDPESEVTTTECGGCINWKNDAKDLWDSGEEPTDATPVVIDGKEVEVTTPAYAYSVDLTNADKLTVKNGGMLMVGAGGVDGATSDNLIVEPGGMICVSPNAEEYAHPTGTVKVSSEYARRKDATADAKEIAALTDEDLYWKHMACPIKSGTLTPSQTGKTYINTWSLKNGWESKTFADMNTPFVGYNISTILRSDTRATDSVVFNFKGELLGNEVDYLKFANTGFTFFGNSYLAPIDIRELLTSLDVNDNVESTVILYHYIEDDYEYVNRAMFAIPTTSAEVAPLEGFFIFSLESASVTYNYTKAVWDAFCAKARVVEGKTSAPARNQSMANNFDAMACVKVASANGKHDKVYLFEGTEFSSMFDNGYDARKMKSNGLQISAMDADKELAIIATNNLEGTALSLSTNDATQYTMSFSNVSGNTYAIYDALTAATVNMTEGATYTFTADANSKLDNRFRVVEARQLPTNVAESKAPVAAKGVYTVLGEYLGEGNNWMSLPSGVYIVNGEKMVR